MEKYVPERTCVCCRKLLPKASLIRIVKNKEGKIFIDNTNRASGRGAYLCKCAECIEKAEKKGFLNRAFKTNVPKEIFDELRKFLG